MKKKPFKVSELADVRRHARHARKAANGFMAFIRSQGVVGLAVGFILGGAISKVVSSIANDLINPLVGALLGSAGELKDAYLLLGNSKLMWGNFVTTCIDFLIIALVVYVGVKVLGVDKLDIDKKSLEPKAD